MSYAAFLRSHQQLKGHRPPTSAPPPFPTTAPANLTSDSVSTAAITTKLRSRITASSHNGERHPNEPGLESNLDPEPEPQSFTRDGIDLLHHAHGSQADAQTGNHYEQMERLVEQQPEPEPSAGEGRFQLAFTHGCKANLPAQTGNHYEQVERLVEPEPEPEPEPSTGEGRFQLAFDTHGCQSNLPAQTGNHHEQVERLVELKLDNSAELPKVDVAVASTSDANSTSVTHPLLKMETDLSRRRVEARQRAEAVEAGANAADWIAARVAMDRDRLAVAVGGAASPHGQQAHQHTNAEGNAWPPGAGNASTAVNLNLPTADIGYSPSASQQTGTRALEALGPTSSSMTVPIDSQVDQPFQSAIAKPRGSDCVYENHVQDRDQRDYRHEDSSSFDEVLNSPDAICSQTRTNHGATSYPPHSLMENEDQAPRLARQRPSLSAHTGVGGEGHEKAANGDVSVHSVGNSRSAVAPIERAAAAVTSLVQQAIDDPGYYGTMDGKLTVDDVGFATSCSTLAEGWLLKKTSSTRLHRWQRRYFTLRQRAFTTDTAANPWLTRSLAYYTKKPKDAKAAESPNAIINLPRNLRAQIYHSTKFNLLVDELENDCTGTRLIMQLRTESDEERHAQMWVRAFKSEWAMDEPGGPA